MSTVRMALKYGSPTASLRWTRRPICPAIVHLDISLYFHKLRRAQNITGER
jgi:hypothetical protein